MNRKPDPLMALTLLVSLGVAMTAVVDAGESFFGGSNSATYSEDHVVLAPLGRHGAGIHMSFSTKEDQEPPRASENGMWQLIRKTPEVRLSLEQPW